MFRKFSALFASVVALAVTAPAHALTSTDLDAIGTEITTSVGVLLPWALGMVAVVLGATISLGLVKKFGRKAGS